MSCYMGSRILFPVSELQSPQTVNTISCGSILETSELMENLQYAMQYDSERAKPIYWR